MKIIKTMAYENRQTIGIPKLFKNADETPTGEHDIADAFNKKMYYYWFKFIKKDNSTMQFNMWYIVRYKLQFYVSIWIKCKQNY